nr:MAG TPA: hypothetical protein [Caudoviricetes sp.]
MGFSLFPTGEHTSYLIVVEKLLNGGFLCT